MNDVTQKDLRNGEPGIWDGSYATCERRITTSIGWWCETSSYVWLIMRWQCGFIWTLQWLPTKGTIWRLHFWLRLDWVEDLNCLLLQCQVRRRNKMLAKATLVSDQFRLINLRSPLHQLTPISTPESKFVFLLFFIFKRGLMLSYKCNL
jgi:hypothetical protein